LLVAHRPGVAARLLFAAQLLCRPGCWSHPGAKVPVVSVDRRVAQHAARQYGLITYAQLLVLGMTRGMLRLRVEDGRLRLVRRGVYAIGGAPSSWPQTVLAAVLAAGSDAVASHVTAGRLWGLKHCDSPPGSSRIHVTAPVQLRIDGVSSHRRSSSRGERRSRLGIPVTSPEQTIVDLAGTMTRTELGQCVDDALRRDLIRLARLRRAVLAAAGPGRRPSKLLREVLSDRIPGYDPGDSDWEREMDRRWDAWGLPPAIRQYGVRANGRTYRLDRAIPDLKVGVEWNGFESHGTRSGFDRDSDRRADLTAAGWHMVDFTSRSSQDRICRAVLAVVAERRHAVCVQ
jgi:hypothetical protein